MPRASKSGAVEDLRHLSFHTTFVEGLNAKGCEHGRKTRSDVEAYKAKAEYEIKQLKTYQGILEEDVVPKLLSKVEASTKMSQDAVSCTSQALLAVETANTVVADLKEKYNHLGWDLLAKFGGFNLLVLGAIVALHHYKLL